MKLGFLLFIVFSLNILFAQTPVGEESFDYSESLKKSFKTPNSPEAEAFAKYGNTSINKYTGQPNIAVPIHSLSGREYTLPVSLTYDASGVLVEEMAGSTGLKWNLNIGGRISRIANGDVDDYISGGGLTYLTNSQFRQNAINYNTIVTFNSSTHIGEYFTFLENLSTRGYDVLPDYFSVNAPGISENIVIDFSTTEPHVLNNPEIIVNYTKVGTSIESWDLILTDGTKLFFGNPSGLGNANDVTTITDYTDSDTNTNAGTIVYNSSWLLTKIESPNKMDVFDFEYETLGEWDQTFHASPSSHVVNAYFDNGTGSVIDVELGQEQISNYGSEHTINQKLIKNVSLNNKMLLDVDYTTRHDINKNSAVNSLIFYSNFDSNTIVNKINFNYDYFKNSIQEIIPNNPDNFFKLRLKLNSLHFTDENNNIKQQYKFEYNGSELPSRYSLSQDYLGYYNGVGNNVLYPKFTTNRDETLDGANRSVNFEKTLKGTLKKMIYPTGGFTEFGYGLHEVKGEDVTFQHSYANFPISGSSAPQGDCNSCCHDVYFPEGGAVIKKRFLTITDEDAGLLNIKFTTNTGDAECFIVQGDKSYSQIINNDTNAICSANPNFIYKISNQSGQPLDVDVNFEAGTYTMIMVIASYDGQVVDDNEPNPTIPNARLEVTGPRTRYVHNYKAGLRIANITNYNRSEDKTLVKDYQYTLDISGETSSGNLITDAKLVKVIPYSAWYQYAGIWVSLPQIHRYSKANSSGIHVAYSKVFEKITNYTPITNDILSTIEPEEGVTLDENEVGTTSFPISNGYTASSFNVGKVGVSSSNSPPYLNRIEGKYEYGKIKRFSVFEDVNQNVKSETESEYLSEQTSSYGGYTVVSNDSNKYKFILATPSNGNYVYSLVNPAWNCWGNGCKPYPVEPPICNEPDNTCFRRDLSPLERRQVSAKGFNGGLTDEIKNTFFNDNSTLQEATTYTYDQNNGYRLKTQELTSSNGLNKKNTYYYPTDLQVDPIYQKLVDKNRLDHVVLKEFYSDNILKSTKKTTYEEVTNNIIRPDKVLFSKGGNSLEERMNYNYDNMYVPNNSNGDSYNEVQSSVSDRIHGNVVEINKINGTITSVFWAYNSKLPIVKVDHAKYNNSGTEFIGYPAIVEAINNNNLNTDIQAISGIQLKDEINTRLRSNTDFQGYITSYVYNANEQIEYETNPNNETIFYEYDNFNRLLNIRENDIGGNILKEFAYNYKENTDDNVGNPTPICDTLLSGQITITGVPTNLLLDTGTLDYNVNVTGGSGNYIYLWEITNLQGVIQDGSVTNNASNYSINYTCSNMDNSTKVFVQCTIIDGDNANLCPLVVTSQALTCN